MKKKSITRGIIFIMLLCSILLTYDAYSRIKKDNDHLKQQLALADNVDNKELDSQLNTIINSLNLNKRDNYAKIKNNYKKFASHGIKTISNFKTEKNFKNFRGTSSGAYAVYQFSPQTFSYVYIIKDTTAANGNLLLGVSPNDFSTEALKYYSFYKIGHFYLKIDVYSSSQKLPSNDVVNLYRFTSQLKHDIEISLEK